MKWNYPSILLFGLVLLSCQNQPKKLIAEMAIKPNLTEVAPKYSDVCFSSRWERPQNELDTFDTFQAARTFHANNIQWVYTTNSDFIKKANDLGYNLQVTLSPIIEDLPFDSKKREKGRILNPKGEKVTAPWMKSWNAWWGCVNHPDFQETYWQYIKSAIDAGAKGFQVDDPALGEMIQRNKYDSVCHCEFCRAKADSLGQTVEEIQKISVLAFHEMMRKKANDYLGEPVYFSCNNFRGVWDLFPFDFFDFGIAEIPQRRGNPEYIFATIREAHHLGKAQVFTYTSEKDWMIKKMIASTYASGGNMLVPWDVWQGSDKPRYFGKAETFSPYFGFVRANQECFDNYEMAFYTNTQIDTNYLIINELPICFSEYRRGIHAYVRAIPDDFEAPIVIHLVDWEVVVEDFKIVLNESLFFEKGIEKIELITPIKYEAETHKNATNFGDFSNLKFTQKINFERNGNSVKVNIPKLEFYWGILIVNPAN